MHMYMYLHVHTHTRTFTQLLDEVRAVGSQKKGTALAGNTVADLVILLRDLPSGEGSVRSGQGFIQNLRWGGRGGTLFWG